MGMCKVVEKIAPLNVCGCTITPEMGALLGILVFFFIVGTGWPFLVFMLLFAMAVKDKYDIDEGIITTVLKSVFCPCCYLLQMYNHRPDGARASCLGLKDLPTRSKVTINVLNSSG